MLYGEYIEKAKDLTITQADNELYYVEPMWRSILDDNEMYFNEISDAQVEPEDILEVLKLEVEKRNTVNSNKPYVLNWLYDLINTQIEPAMLQEETDFIKQVTEFMKTNHELQK